MVIRPRSKRYTGRARGSFGLKRMRGIYRWRWLSLYIQGINVSDLHRYLSLMRSQRGSLYLLEWGLIKMEPSNVNNKATLNQKIFFVVVLMPSAVLNRKTAINQGPIRYRNGNMIGSIFIAFKTLTFNNLCNRSQRAGVRCQGSVDKKAR